jgi:NmrA-like family
MKIVVAGAHGNLGVRIARELATRGADVVAVPRDAYASTGALADVCRGAACVVSAVSGLRAVVVDAQAALATAAATAGVPRFIPSDYSIDFAKLSPGGNRNLDWRRELHERIADLKLAVTTVFNGAFSTILTRPGVLLDYDKRTVAYWGNADQLLDFTSWDNTAAFTAAAALDASTPRYLRIAGAEISARQLAELTGYTLVRAGGVAELTGKIEQLRAARPETDSPYPAWQGMQYLRDMFDGRAKLAPLDNAHYEGIAWQSAREMINAGARGVS